MIPACHLFCSKLGVQVGFAIAGKGKRRMHCYQRHFSFLLVRVSFAPPLFREQSRHRSSQITISMQLNAHRPCNAQLWPAAVRPSRSSSVRRVTAGRRAVLVRAEAAAGGDKVVCVGEALFGESGAVRPAAGASIRSTCIAQGSWQRLDETCRALRMQMHACTCPRRRTMHTTRTHLAARFSLPDAFPPPLNLNLPSPPPLRLPRKRQRRAQGAGQVLDALPRRRPLQRGHSPLQAGCQDRLCERTGGR